MHRFRESKLQLPDNSRNHLVVSPPTHSHSIVLLVLEDVRVSAFPHWMFSKSNFSNFRVALFFFLSVVWTSIPPFVEANFLEHQKKKKREHRPQIERKERGKGKERKGQEGSDSIVTIQTNEKEFDPSIPTQQEYHPSYQPRRVVHILHYNSSSNSIIPANQPTTN